MVDIAIIGAGPVGIFTTFQAGMLGLKCTLIDSLSFIGGQCTALYPQKPIYDIPGYPSITGQELIDNLYTQAKVFKPLILLGARVEKIEFKDVWNITLSSDVKLSAKTIVIAGGCGSFGPNKPPLMDIELYENKTLFYMINDKNQFKDKTVMIAGGGDSAVDWAIELSSIAKKIYLVHRRNSFKAFADSISQLNKIVSSGKIEILTPYQLHKLNGSEGILSEVEIIDFDGNIKVITIDFLLPFFGLSMDLGPISDWGLNISRKHIQVDYSTMQTDKQGIYAIGDIAQYMGKLKLILSGFSEAAIAVHDIYQYINPNKQVHFEYSTTKGLPID